MSRLLRVVLLFIPMVVGVTPVESADWAQFRGGPLQGHVAGGALPSEPKMAWHMALPGTGWSQPITFGRTIYLATAVSDPPLLPKDFSKGAIDPRSMPGSKAEPPDVQMEWRIVALDLETGTTLWSATAAVGKPQFAIHPSNTYATETPCADAQGIYAYFGATGTVVAFDHAGKLLWTHELGAHPTDENFGTGSSPVLVEGKLVLQCFSKDEAVLMCLDARTGDELWHVAREQAGTSWSTPLVWHNRVRTEVIASGQKLMTSHDPTTGQELWRISGINAPSTASLASSPDAIFFGHRSPFSAGPLYAVEAGKSGELSLANEESNVAGQLWSQKGAAPGMATPLVLGDCVYVLNNAVLSCHDVRTGEPHYKKRIPGMATVAASPVARGDHVVVIDEKGKVAFVAGGPEFKVDATLDLEDVVWSSPALADGRLLVRGVNQLYCITLE